MFSLLEFLESNRFVGSFGIPYLDKKVSGILPNDLILIGARSGAGKSSLALSVAAHNSHNGSNVGLITLENFKGDDLATKAYYEYMKLTGNYSLSQRQFTGGMGTTFKPDLEALAKAESAAIAFFKNIKLTVRKKGFTLEDLKTAMVKNVIEDKCKIIILDHIDYIDKIDPRADDNSHVTEIMRTIRELQDIENVAVIAFSHLRKASNTKDSPKIPSMDEFIGSGNKVKEATMVIVFAPDDNRNETAFDKKLRSTFCCIRKLRMGGYDNTCARLQFDTRTGNYTSQHDELLVNYSGTEVTSV